MEKKDILETFPVLETDRLKFIQITSKHLQNLFEIYANEKVMEFYDSYPHSSTIETDKVIALFEQRFKDKTGIRWGFTIQGENKIIGTIGFNRFKSDSYADLGFDLNENYWNRGIITEAVRTVIHFGFSTLKIHRIEAGVTPGNIASEKVLLKNGFINEGTIREREFWKGKHQTYLFYSKLSTDK